MKALSVLAAVIFCATASAAPLEISSYDVRLVTAADGSASGTASIVFSGVHDGTVSAPFGFAEPTQVAITSAPLGTRVSCESFNGQSRLRFQMPLGVSGETRIDLSFHAAGVFAQPEAAAGQKRVLPEGSSMLRHRLVNTEPYPIRSYRLLIELPATLRAQSIVEALPKPGKKEAEPRVQLAAAASGAAGVTLRAAGLQQGDTASVQVELSPAARSPYWLIAGLLLSILYLVYFRDLVATPAGSPARRGEVPRSGE